MRHLPSPLATLTAVLLTACAHSAGAEPPAASADAAKAANGTRTRPVVDSDAAALEAARQNPISRPEPRTLYPEQAPPARPARGLPEKSPPPREERPLLPEQAPQPREAPSSELTPSDQPAGELGPAETRVIAPEQPPLQPFAESRPRPPAPEYVWAPGYWYWYGGQYVWINGDWVAPRPGHVYVSARWVYASDGWEFSPGGWAVSIGGPVVYPFYPYYGYPYRYGYGYGYPRHHHDWNHRHWDSGHRRWNAPDRTVVRPSHRYDAPRRSNVRPSTHSTTTVVRPRSSGRSNVNVGDLEPSGNRVRVKARRR